MGLSNCPCLTRAPDSEVVCSPTAQCRQNYNQKSAFLRSKIPATAPDLRAGLARSEVHVLHIKTARLQFRIHRKTVPKVLPVGVPRGQDTESCEMLLGGRLAPSSELPHEPRARGEHHNLTGPESRYVFRKGIFHPKEATEPRNLYHQVNA